MLTLAELEAAEALAFSLPRIADDLEKVAGLVPGSFRLTITPVDYLLPGEKDNG